MTAEDICDPCRNSRNESIRAARRRAEERQSYDIEVFRYLTQQLTAAQVNVEVVERGLEVLAAIAPPARLHGALRTALAHDDARVRSKAAVAVGRAVADLPLLQRLLSDNDPRVRANTIEALWCMKSEEIESIFLGSLADQSQRVVANAIYGLYLIDEEKYFGKIAWLVEHPHAGYRTAGAWLLGKAGNPDHLPLLKSLLLERNPDVRSAAFRTLKILRSASRNTTPRSTEAA